MHAPFHHSKRALLLLFLYIKRSIFIPNLIKIGPDSVQNAGNMFQNFLGKLNTLYSKRTGKIISFYIKMTIFGIILRNIWSKYIHQNAPNCTIFNNFWEDLFKPVMYAHLLHKKKIRYKKVSFSLFLNDPLQFIKKNLHWLHQLFWKKATSTLFLRFLKNTFNFTRSCPFPQKAKFYSLKC